MTPKITGASDPQTLAALTGQANRTGLVATPAVTETYVPGSTAVDPEAESPSVHTAVAHESLLHRAEDLANAVKFAEGGLQYTAEEAVGGKATLGGKTLTLGIAHPERALDDQPVPKIDRPVVIVPGWTSTLSNYAPLAAHLTKDGANGQTYYVKQGQFYSMGPNNQLVPLASPPQGGKVFEMIFSDNHQSPQANLPELSANMDAISKATGVQKIDTIAHSMGGIDTRLYLDQGGDHVNKFMMVGTPNHGTPFGNEALGVVDDHIGWAEKLGGLSNDDIGSLSALRVEADNPFLQDLNSRSAAQFARTAGVQTEANGLELTPQAGIFGGTHDGGGDGLVPTDSVAMPGATNNVHHENLAHRDLTFGSAQIYGNMMNFFDWN